VLEKSTWRSQEKSGRHRANGSLSLADAVTQKGLRSYGHARLRSGVSGHGQIAGGAKPVCFNHRAGSCFGSVTVADDQRAASNTPMFTKMQDDMDIPTAAR